jgi:translocation and assembly module TamB
LLVYSSVRIVLGEDVQLRGFGLTGRIRGSVLATDEPGRLTTGTGELEIVDGRYTALGAPLEVDPGRLLFTGGPVDDPGLNARATREVGTVTVGVNVRGRLREPEVTVFSDPEMTQIEALSYLLYGRSSQQASESQAAVLLRTASALRAMKGGSDPFRDLADRMGFTEAYIEGGDGDAGASVVVGRYLSPRLYASYALGLFEPVNTLRLSYKLTERWTAQTETSTTQQGGDLLYVIER